MIEVDQKALDESMRKFSESIAHKAAFLNVATSRVLKVECNRLAQTLMHYTPPLNRASAGGKIEKDVRRAMRGKAASQKLLDKYWPAGSVKHGRGDVYWYCATENVLLGARVAMDLKSASDEETKRFYRSELKTFTVGQEEYRHGDQSVKIRRRFIIADSQIKRLVARLKKNIGRLKAGWLVGWRKTGAGIGIYRPPQWVLDHENANYSEGDITKIDDKNVPEVTLKNRAHAVNTPGMRRIANAALQTRIGAIPNRLAQIIKHPELLEKEVA